ncbi:MAG: NAD+ synthase [Candidatus Curtissbacteria bacterium]|nr:NAD+ synthase [Candidatus Curtissbacteria bacterium]
MKIALLQFNAIVGDLKGNAAKIKRLATIAKSKGAKLCVTPELALLGYPPRDLLLRPGFIAAASDLLQTLAKDTKFLPPIIVGTAIANKNKSGRPLFNCAAFLKDGKVQELFHKSLLPTYDVFDEDRYFEPATQSQLLRFGGKKIGISICEDLWNDRDFWHRPRYHFDPIEKLALEKVDFIINLSSSPFTADKQKLRESMISASSKKYKMPIVYVNQVGGNDDLIFDGASLVFDGQGKLLARAKAFEDDLLVINLNSKSTVINDYPENKEALIFEALTLGVGDYLSKCGFGQALIGISGGIDSAVVAAITSHALGPKNVTGVLMPSPYTSHQSIADAQRLAKNLGIKTVTIEIAGLMKTYENALKSALYGFKKDITEENIQARIRGNLLMALSNKYKALVLSTGNKSELTVGYTTLYGDLAGGIAIIGDLSKTQVYKLAGWINREDELIPKSIIKRAPSAELRPNQKDQDSLPTYDILDKILTLYIENHEGPEQIVSKGFDKNLVKKVLSMVVSAEFKRRQSPPTLKVTSRAFGSGWRMPIAARNKFLK